MEGESRISAWAPGQRFAYTQDRPNGVPVVVEFEIEGQGDSTVLRLPQSGFGADESFDNEYESTSRAWMLFLRRLKHGLEQPHKTATNVIVCRYMERPREQTWQTMLDQTAAGQVIYDD